MRSLIGRVAFVPLLILLSFCVTAGAGELKRPNILLAISDDQSWPHCSVYGSREISTPAFDRLATTGVLFTNAIAASPGCSPCRAALLTGRQTWQIENAGTHASSFPQKYQVFPDLLEASGYQIGYTGKGWGPGNWKISGRKRNPAGPAYSKIKNRNHPKGISSNDYAANFESFLKQRQSKEPFFFWYGATEPHRDYEKGIGRKQKKNIKAVSVPEFLPDHPEIRSDILDYYVEIEWFDSHLARMLKMLEAAGELENTLIIVTSDNGMPFPRAKANCYEYGIHMPLAISWPAGIAPKRTVSDLIGFVDITATILDAAKVKHPSQKYPLAGKSFLDLLRSKQQGKCDPNRQAVYSARERHSSSRYQNFSYPQRAIRSEQYLLIRNFRPNRWPAGAPQKYEQPNILGPLHAAYHDIDACPSLTFLIEHRETPAYSKYFHWAVDKRPELELFDINKDSACLNNLAEDPHFKDVLKAQLAMLNEYLKSTADPRILDGGDIFETYPRYSRIRSFPAPE